MIETMNMKCPICNADFPVDIYTGESSLNCDATLSRTSTFQLNLHDLYNEICNGYTNEVLSEGDRISVKVRPSLAPLSQRVTWDVSIPCPLK